MASVVWMGVSFLLMAELVIVSFLVLPLPRIVRRFIARKIFTYDLGRRVRFISNFIIMGLIVAVADAVSTLRRLEGKEIDEHHNIPSGFANGANAGYITTSMDKQRKFRAQRNMYLAGFALTLMFCIARIVELMQATVNAEDETDSVKKRLIASEERAANTSSTLLEDSSNIDDTAPPGEPGSTPFVLRRRNVSATESENAEKED